MAWLNATPKPPEGSKRATIGSESRRTRAETLKAQGAKLVLPPNPAPHLIGWLVELGISEAAGMGMVPLSWREIRAWQEATGITLSPWEARLLRTLSAEYLAEGRRAESETAPPPWAWEITPEERDTTEAQLRMVLG